MKNKQILKFQAAGKLPQLARYLMRANQNILARSIGKGVRLGYIQTLPSASSFYDRLVDLPIKSWNSVFSGMRNFNAENEALAELEATGIRHLPWREPSMEREMTREIVNAARKHQLTGLPLNMIVAESPNGPLIRYIPGNTEEIGRYLFGIQNGLIDPLSPRLVRSASKGEIQDPLSWRPDRKAPDRVHRMFGQDYEGVVMNYSLSPKSNSAVSQGLIFDSIEGKNPYRDVSYTISTKVSDLERDLKEAIAANDTDAISRILLEYQNIPDYLKDPFVLERMEWASPLTDLNLPRYNKAAQKSVFHKIRPLFKREGQTVRIISDPSYDRSLGSIIDPTTTDRVLGSYYLKPGQQFLDIPTSMSQWNLYRNGSLKPEAAEVSDEVVDFMNRIGAPVPEGYDDKTPITSDYLFNIIGQTRPKHIVRAPVNDFHGAYQYNPITKLYEYPSLIGVHKSNLGAVTQVDANALTLRKGGLLNYPKK